MWFDKTIGTVLSVVLLVSMQICYFIWQMMFYKFVKKVKHKKIILSYAVIFIILSAISLCTGIIALISQQPFHVWFPFIIYGSTSIVCMVSMYIVARITYTKAELKKMNVDDLT